MIEIEEVPELRSPVLIAAFEGWNDAADAASSVIDHLLHVWNARVGAAIDPE
ncbi:MAG: PAC2 family protein, partial [Nocardioidaceae bacterium]|nr:PAC2 family protein [Nocardioidaceae bacterium]